MRLDGQGDWDVALFGADGQLVAGGGSPDGQEIAQGWTLAPGTLTVQACRRSGTGGAELSVAHEPLVGDAAAARADAPQIVSVTTLTRADKDRLVALGLDLTEHGGKTAVGVVLHGAADGASCGTPDSPDSVLVKDLVAKDGARDDRARAATTLPSGRTSYRQLADYETEMKALADKNPGFVRLFTLPYKTFEGREVKGIEITENVAGNDGKPVFLNMGVHHAREWPAGELTMEWAYELINGYKANDPRATDRAEEPHHRGADRQPGRLQRLPQHWRSADGKDETAGRHRLHHQQAGEYRRKNCRVGR